MGFGERRPLELRRARPPARHGRETGRTAGPVAGGRARRRSPPADDPAQHVDHLALHRMRYPISPCSPGVRPVAIEHERRRRGRRRHGGDRRPGHRRQRRHQRAVLWNWSQPRPSRISSDHLAGVTHRLGEPRRQRPLPIARSEQRRDDPTDVGAEVVGDDRLLYVHWRSPATQAVIAFPGHAGRSLATPRLAPRRSQPSRWRSLGWRLVARSRRGSARSAGASSLAAVEVALTRSHRCCGLPWPDSR